MADGADHQIALLRRCRSGGAGQRNTVEAEQAAIDWAAINYLRYRCPSLSASEVLSPRQKSGLFVLLAVVLAALLLQPQIFLVSLFTLSSVYFFILFFLRLLLLRISLASRAAYEKTPPLSDTQLPVITILAPLYREARSLPHLIKALDALDYPPDRLDIKIILEAEDIETRAAAARLCRVERYDIVIVPPGFPRTKPKACNQALWRARGKLVVIFDAEDRPEPDQLRKAAAAFHHGPDNLACVQAQLNFYNRDRNWLTRLFAIEYAVYFDLMLPALVRLGLPIPLGGTSNYFRTEFLIAAGGWDPFNVTEDADLGMRIAASGYRTAMIRSTTWEEAVWRPTAWMRQRSRWIKGFLQTWLVHLRRPMRPVSRGRLLSILSLHWVIGANIVAALINPVLWLLFVLFLAGRLELPPELMPRPVYIISLFSFLAGNLLQLYIYLLAPLERRWFTTAPALLLMPTYWALAFAAGMISVWQLVRNPFYWEKTEHHTDQPAGPA